LLGGPFDPLRAEFRGTAAPVLVDVAANRLTGGGQFDFSQTGTLVYLSSTSRILSYPIVWLDKTGKTLPLQPAPGDYGMPRLSPDGRHLALVSVAGGAAASDILVYDLQRDNMTKITFGGQLNSRPVWTPDGKHIVYVSHHGGRDSLIWVRADGAGEPQRLMESKEVMLPYSFSPDGKRLAYSAISPETSADLWTLPLDISDPAHPKPGKAEAFLRTPTTEFSPAFSPDGRWMAYQSEATSSSTEVHVRPFPGPGGNWQISSGGGSFPVWSRDGRELLYATPDGHIMATAYTAKGDSFLWEKVHLWSNQQILISGSLPNFDLSSDGKRLVVFPLPRTSNDTKASVHVTFLLNFFDELRRRMPAASR
jgi:serine/threonine-protein kinase